MSLSKTEQEPWYAVEELLRGDKAAGLIRQFPKDEQSISLVNGLTQPGIAASSEQAEQGRMIHDSLIGLLDQLSVFESISRCPILAITGMLNAGKSSLLATYLSPHNRPRVLRGLGNAAGTHRFVLWLPSLWQEQPDLLNTLIGFLSNLFGHPPELLSEDPAQAALQYNGRILNQSLLFSDATQSNSLQEVDPQGVPLLAYDAALDELKLGLVDCPDIQTGFYGTRSLLGDDLAQQRREQLSRIGRLCSAFIVVTKMGSLHDNGLLQILTTLRDAMPGVPRLLAINKVKARYAPETVYEEARGLLERFGLRSVFAAYDYRSQLAVARIPSLPPKMIADANGADLPIFYQIGGTGIQGSYLHDLGDQLDSGALSRESRRSLVLQLKAKALMALEWMDTNHQLCQQQIRDAWQAIADACYDFMAERDASGKAIGLRLQASPAIVSQMADSLQRTAPVWMRLSLSIDRTARQLQQAVANSAARFKILQSASDSVMQFTKRFRRGEGAQVVTPERLSAAIRKCDIHDALQRVSQERLRGDCEVAMQRFAAEDNAILDTQELDEWSRRVWKEMSFKQKVWKGTQPLAVITAPLLAVVLVPFDGGGSAVLVFASAKELLAAAGLAALIGPLGTGNEALNIVHRETPWRQLSDLFAVTCDAIGLPRPAAGQLPSAKAGGEMRHLLSSELKYTPAAPPPAVQVWKMQPTAAVDLRMSLQDLPI